MSVLDIVYLVGVASCPSQWVCWSVAWSCHSMEEEPHRERNITLRCSCLFLFSRNLQNVNCWFSIEWI